MMGHNETIACNNDNLLDYLVGSREWSRWTVRPRALAVYFVGPCTRGLTARDGIGSPNTSATKSLGSLMIIHQRVFENAFSNGQIVIKSRLRCAQGARARREET
jgi:hypothetical protein